MALFKKRSKEEAATAALGRVLQGHEIPNLSQIVMQILKRIRDPDTTIEEIGEALQWDPSLVVRVLRTVNSAAYGPARPIDCVRHAVNYMGRSQLEQIVIALAVKDAVPDRPAPEFEPKRYWAAAAYRAAFARLIASRLHPATASEAFTVGLLQDMAVPVLATARSDDYAPVLREWSANESLDLAAIEKEAFGWSHADIGGLLGRLWELPAGLTGSIVRHHKSDCTDRELLPAVRMVGVLHEVRGEFGLEVLTEIARGDYGLEPDWVIAAAEDAGRQAAELAAMLG